MVGGNAEFEKLYEISFMHSHSSNSVQFSVDALDNTVVANGLFDPIYFLCVNVQVPVGVEHIA
jgi:hypothetical protein